MRLADCHPQRKHYAFGMCRKCYEADLKQRNPEFAERQAKNKVAWNKDNPDKMKGYLKARKERERRSPEALRQRASSELKRKYNISIEDYESLLIKQNNGCALCF